MPELLAVLDFHSGPAELVPIDTSGPELRYRTPAPDFSLSRFELSDGAAAVRAVNGPEIVIVTQGGVTVRRYAESVALKSGASAFVPAEGGDYLLEGTGSVFRARVNDLTTE